MNKFLLLFKVNLQAVLNPSKIANSGYAKNNNKRIVSIFLVVLLGIVMLSISTLYMYLIGKGLNEVGLIDVLPLLGMISATVIILFTGLYQTQSYLFSANDMDMLLSLPVPKWSIMLSKISTLYIENLLFSAIVALPAGAIYFYFSKCSFVFWIYYIISFFLIPLFPLIIATIIGYLLGLVSSRFKFKNFVAIFSSLLAMFLGYYITSNLSKLLENIVASIKTIQEMYFKIYFPAEYFYKAIINFSFIDLIIFALLSVIPFVIFVAILSKFYQSIITQLNSSRKNSNYKHKSLKGSSKTIAIYKKELGRYFSSPIYVLNTAIGMIMLFIMAVSSFFLDAATMAQILNAPGAESMIYQVVLAAMFFMITLSSTTASSISLEGVNLWILKSSPVNIWDVFMAKIYVNLTIILPILYISIAALSISLSYTLPIIIITIISTTLAAIFTSVLGLAINLIFPKFDFTSDVQVVKQSMSMIISTFGSMILTGILIMLYVVKLNEIFSFEIYVLMVSAILIIFTLCCIMFINTKGKNIFYKL
jgi:ABC-2 type transport system permease protein